MATMLETVKSWLRWVLAYGFGQTFLRLYARRGSLVAKALVDPTIQDDPYPVYEAVRSSGPDIGGKAYNPATISYAATKQMLRSRDFGVGGGHGELPAFLRRLLAKVQAPEVAGVIDALSPSTRSESSGSRTSCSTTWNRRRRSTSSPNTRRCSRWR